MSSWTAGYVADINYTHGFYRELTPALLSLVPLIVGLGGTTVGSPLHYCELGCGRGFSINLLAAANPEIQFHATDFNPSQIAGAKALAVDAQLSNAHFYDATFSEFGDTPGLPDQFDIISLHGIYSWISFENRQHIVQFIKSKLKVGGIVYISYNALPGWAAAMPLRQLLIDAASRVHGPTARKVPQALDAVAQFLKSSPAYLAQNPTVGPRFDKLKDMPHGYLAHEYFNRDWTPFYFADVASDLAEAKLSFVGSTHYLDHIDSINFTDEQRELLGKSSDIVHREATRDYILNQQFRRDVFIKGPLSLTPRLAREAWLKQRFALSTNRADIELRVKAGRGEATMQADIYAPILDRLSAGPATLREMVGDARVGQISWSNLQQALVILIGAGHVQPALPAKDDGKRARTTKPFNQAVLHRARDSGDLQSLASPVTGGGVGIGRFQQLFLLAFTEGKKTSEEWAEFAWQVISSQGQAVVKEGKRLDTAEENLAEIGAQAKLFEKQLPVLKSLQII
ncbi:putative methyltransferase regulatory domain protein [Variibacter gotjawalensis]|uniref:Putative methyltransferase regulatory domain protein n=1 Tax=Variibacter gotjawalensis TaxID=1333996 RepID=A0A0S3PNQ6_9BRAD|nr:class I SAM-dependent methyltransferase [Variibacter gotjawalensis]NIK47860.1 SAM-dependent methyltransferase [Variibacter gotjawalensis]RZS49746.1 methyltransferase family protein [Variibacter gotjawalensis]BAT57574.1 putative methyltransferase regulatory domain protein [Variibacter gotjawalensis]